MKKILILLTSTIIILIGCTKDESINSNTDLLTESVWIHECQITDTNNNSTPDDDNGPSKDLRLSFNEDGTLDYTMDGNTQELMWEFLSDETIIKVIGYEDPNIISASNEIQMLIYELSSTNLIFQGTSVDNPEQLIFDKFKKE